MENETLRGAMQRQAAAVAAAARADDAAAEMGRRVRVVTAEFLVEAEKLGNPGVSEGNGWRGWMLAAPRGPDRENSGKSGIALATDGTWLNISDPDNLPSTIENPASCFISGPLFRGFNDLLRAREELESRGAPHVTLEMEPLDTRTLPYKALLLRDVDIPTLESPAALAAYYLATLLAYLPVAYPPSPPSPPAPAAPAPPKRRASWWRRA